MIPEELPDAVGVGPLQGLERGPSLKEVATQTSPQIAQPLPGLGVVELEGVRQRVAELGLEVDELATVLAEHVELASLRIIGTPWPQPIRVLVQIVENELSVDRIVLRSAGGEGLTVAGESRRWNREDRDEVVLHERVDEGTAAEFDRHGDGPFESSAQVGDPFIQRLRGVVDLPPLDTIGADGTEGDVVLPIGPVDADEGREAGELDGGGGFS